MSANDHQHLAKNPYASVPLSKYHAKVNFGTQGCRLVDNKKVKIVGALLVCFRTYHFLVLTFLHFFFLRCTFATTLKWCFNKRFWCCFTSPLANSLKRSQVIDFIFYYHNLTSVDIITPFPIPLGSHQAHKSHGATGPPRLIFFFFSFCNSTAAKTQEEVVTR